MWRSVPLLNNSGSEINYLLFDYLFSVLYKVNPVTLSCYCHICLSDTHIL